MIVASARTVQGRAGAGRGRALLRRHAARSRRQCAPWCPPAPPRSAARPCPAHARVRWGTAPPGPARATSRRRLPNTETLKRFLELSAPASIGFRGWSGRLRRGVERKRAAEARARTSRHVVYLRIHRLQLLVEAATKPQSSVSAATGRHSTSRRAVGSVSGARSVGVGRSQALQVG